MGLSGQQARITSYNVCYTKLLRDKSLQFRPLLPEPLLSLLDGLQDPSLRLVHDILPFLYDAHRILSQRIDHVGDGVGEVLQDPFSYNFV